MAAPQSTSINAITATPDMKWVFSGGTDGYVRMYNWVDTANGKVPLTVAQKHPFVDSVMKAGSLVTYWENEEASTLKTPPSQPDEGKWTSPVYSLAVQHQATWLLSGLESGGINLQTCRHHAGTRITTLKGHTSAVSVLSLSLDETSLLSGSWDKNIFDWDLNAGKVKRSFGGSGSQISAMEIRPMSDTPVPEVTETQPEPTSGTFSSNNADKSLSNGAFASAPGRRPSRMGDGEEDAMGSPDGSLFGDNDHGSLFGEDTAAGGGANAFGEDDDDLTRALQDEMSNTEQDAAGEADAEMSGLRSGGSVQPPDAAPVESGEAASGAVDGQSNGTASGEISEPSAILTNGLPHSDEPLTAPPTNEDQRSTTADLPPQSESTFLDAAIDGTLRIWDRRMPTAVATILPYGGTPPWCTGACWSPDGNFFYAGRRISTVEEYSIHHLGSKRSEPNRTFKFQNGSGPVYAVRAMPNKKHLVCASHDILRIYDLKQAETKHKTVPFTIVPGHRGGVISSVYIDPSCRFMLSAAGNRGWEGNTTEVLLGYEIGFQDEKGIWHR
ncbi:Transcription factor SPT8 [Lecanosticta acicola]|uniref:Transcription factor SPT8 n=1 Tax=Lecanosticta acicola TaxID=111012 RepID=A0AAI8Z0C8_9PEZI|nr:Transcription factor SPT8 [Lecanosticta acicola]